MTKLLPTPISRPALLALLSLWMIAGSRPVQAAWEELSRLPPVAEPAVAGGAEHLPAPVGAPHAAEPTLAGPTLAEPTGAPGPIADGMALSGPEEIFEPTPYWYQSSYWFGPACSGGVELGINGSEGNAQSFSLRVGGNLEYKTDVSTWTFKATHAKTESRDVLTQNNAIGNARYDRDFGESQWSLFSAGTLEYDTFKAWDYRMVLNGGFGYQFWCSDAGYLKARFGSGVSREVGGPDNDVVPEAVFGMDFEHHLSRRQKLTMTVDYFPEWGEFADNYRVVSNAGWQILLDEETNLSLKIAVIDRYDNTPHGAKPNDVDYSILLLWEL